MGIFGRMAFAVAGALLLAAPAAAENRVFIIANNADGYGIDRCLATGSRCGSAAAHAYCKSRAFAQAVAFHQIDRDDITGAVPTDGDICSGSRCGRFVAIECAR